jgi:hypothetical protein
MVGQGGTEVVDDLQQVDGPVPAVWTSTPTVSSSKALG